MSRHLSIVLVSLVSFLAAGCGLDETSDNVPRPQSLAVRAQRRAFAGAPPVIPHPPLSGTCSTCHTIEGGRVVPGVGIAPANPHIRTRGLSEQSRCKQCHVFQATDDVFAASDFVPWQRQEPHGERAHPSAPPTIPHSEFMREVCRACHAGDGARPEVVCRHAERLRCLQCHVGQDDTVKEDSLIGERRLIPEGHVPGTRPGEAHLLASGVLLSARACDTLLCD